MDKASKRLAALEANIQKSLDVIADLQRKYQEIIEAQALGAAKLQGASTAEEGSLHALHSKLERLTIKRHAALTASLGGVGYQELAKITGWDVTTVKLQLRAALHILGIPNRAALLVSHRRLLDGIPDKECLRRYSLSKRWRLDQPGDLMDVLRSIKKPANQYTAPRDGDAGR